MGIFEQFPYTNFHELNLDWILKALKELEHTIDEFVAINALKYADPIQWNITSQYEKNTIVIDPVTGTAYISVQPVPSGVALTNTDYWSVVFDLGSFVTKAAKNFTSNYEEETTLTATFPTNAGDWIVWGDILYYTLVNITAGDTYVPNSNIKQFTMEELIGHLGDLTTTDKSSIVNAINELENHLGNSALNTVAQNVSDAINELESHLGNSALNTVAQNVSDAVNELENQLGNSALNTVAQNVSDAVNELENQLGNSPLDTVAQNVSDAINELENHLGNATLQTIAQNVSDAINELVHDPVGNLRGKKFFFSGDSIMYGLLSDSSQSAYNFPKVFGDLTGATVYNDAISGASITNYDVNSFCNRVSSIDFTQYDYAVLEFGFNDVGHGVNLHGTDTSAFDFAYDYCINQMLTSNPELKIVLCSPTFTTNAMGRYAPSDICAQDIYYEIREIALKHNLSFVDFEYGAGINSTNSSTYQWDGLHFNDIGYQALGEYLARNFIQSAPMLQAAPLAQTLDTGVETSGYRITFDQAFGSSGVCLALITNENSKCMNFSLVTKSGYSVCFEYNGDVDQWQFKSGFINLHPDASTAVSCALDRITPTGFTGQVFWYGNTSNITILSIPI